MENQQKDNSLMFDRISDSYDSINHILSLGLDKIWRKKFVKYLIKIKPNYDVVADIASGTGDLLINLQELNAAKYYAIDPSEKMLEIGKSKVSNAEFINAYAENLPLNNNSVDLVAISFGIRNFSDLNKSFSELYRILKQNGILSIMEFSIPNFLLFRWGFFIYIDIFIPIIIKVLSKDKEAYKYLRKSIIEFNKNVDVIKLLKSKNFKEISTKKLCLGAITIYNCVKQ